MAEIVELNCMTTLPIPPDKILEKANGKLNECVVLGWEIDSENIYISSSTSSLIEVSFLLQRALHTVNKMLDE